MQIGLIIDAILILIIVVNIIIGRIRGMVKVLRGFLVPILAILLTMAFNGLATNCIREMDAFDKIENKVSEIIVDRLPATDTSNLETLTPQEKEAVRDVLGQFGVSEEESDMLLNGNAMQTGQKALFDMITYSIAQALAYVVVFVFAVIFLSILFIILGAIFRNKLLSHADHLLGTFIGGLKGFLLVFVLIFVANKAAAFLYTVLPMIQNSLEESFIYTVITGFLKLLS